MVEGINFQLSEDQIQVRDLAHEFAEKELRPRASEADRTGIFPDGLLELAHDAGLTTYQIPEQYGGGGMNSVTSALIMEELAWGDLGLSTLFGSGQLFTGGVLAANAGAADDSRVAPWFELICRPGGAFGSIAFSEPHAGSDVANVRTSAVRDGDEWIINGEKTWITGGGVASAILVFARTGEPGPNGISTFVVEGDRKGLTTHKLDLLGLRGGNTCSIFFDDVRVPEQNRIGEEGEGFASAMRFFMYSRPQVGAASVGLARAAFEYAADYANSREAFGKPISRYQGVGFQLAEMGMKVEAARALAWKAAAAADRGEDVGLIGSYAKAFASDVAMEVTTNAVQIMGGAGVSKDHPVERWMRDAKIMQIVEGTNEIQKLIASRYYQAGVFNTP